MTLVLDGIGVRLGGVQALEGVSLTVPDGAVVGIMGPNGAGKTTVLNAICGLVPPRTGTITLDGAPLRVRPEQLTAHGIARTLQDLGLFPSLTVIENVAAGASGGRAVHSAASLLGLRRPARVDPAARDRAFSILGELGLREYADRLPEELPHAARKRVALARALISEPRLLLLDEPAGGLSAEEVAELATVIRRLPHRRGGGRSVLLVEHRWDLLLSVCDEVVVLDLGRVVARGTPAQIREDPAVARAYLGLDP